MTTLNQCVKLQHNPSGFPETTDFIVSYDPLPSLNSGEVLVRNEWLSLDPYMRGQISGRHMSEAVEPGDVMRGETLGEVIESKSDFFKPGDKVRAMLGWQQYAKANSKDLSIVPDNIKHHSYLLSLLGMPGLTAYAGLTWLANAKAGDTVVVAAATGAVGSTVVRLAKLSGCKVVGISSSEKKCRFAVDTLGADFCINRLEENLEESLREHCSDGIDIYFDLVGGEILNITSKQLAIGARVILCGLTTDYNRTNNEPTPGPSPVHWIIARAHVHGLVVYDFEHRRQEFIDACLPLVDSGQLFLKEDIIDGLENAPQAFIDLLKGKNFGKVLVKI